LEDENEQVKERAYYYIDMLSEKTEEEMTIKKKLSKPLTFDDIDCIEAYIGNLESTMDVISDPSLITMDKIAQFADQNENIIQQRKEQEEEDIDTQHEDNQNQKLRKMLKKSNKLIEDYNDLYEEHQLFNKCGELQKVLGPLSLTEEDAEY
jgi:hypothetical protein